MIFQDPMTSLNPTMKIGAQIMEGLLYHRLLSREKAKERALELLHLVGIPDSELRFSQFPHQLSGGCVNESSLRSPWPPNPAY